LKQQYKLQTHEHRNSEIKTGIDCKPNLKVILTIDYHSLTLDRRLLLRILIFHFLKSNCILLARLHVWHGSTQDPFRWSPTTSKVFLHHHVQHPL